MKRPPRALAWLLLPIALAPIRGSAARDQSSIEFFEARVRPVLASRCHSCHGDEKPKGKLSLTSRAAILAGGQTGPAAVSGRPDESLLVDVLRHDSEPRMPPKGKLPDSEIEALTRWVELGLPWPGETRPAEPSPGTSGPGTTGDHWAFLPVRPVDPPEVANAAWARNPIDHFILAKLESEGLAPSPEADRRTLIRRLSLDLTGLPPDPDEVSSFVSDPAPDAYERLVERLLAHPRMGEQWGRHWLDIARYSDTKGYVYAREEGRWVHSWAYRDWVVRSINHDLPYDRFLTLQLAADQLAGEPADLAAMGFLTLGRRFLGVTHDIIDDRIDVVTRGTLGLTVACARCHDHKFDPVPTADYYALYGVFKNTSARLVPTTSASVPEGEFLAGLREREAKLNERMKAERAAAAQRARARVGDYLQAQLEMEKYPEEGFDQILSETDLIPAFVRRWRDALARTSTTGDPIFRAWNAFLSQPSERLANEAPSILESLRAEPGPAVNARILARFTEPPSSAAEVVAVYREVFQEVITEWERAREKDPDSIQGLTDPAGEEIRRLLHGPDSPCEVPDEPIVDTEAYFPTAATEALWRLQGDVDRWLISRADAPPYAEILVDRPQPTDARILRRGNPATPGEVVPRRFLRVVAGPDAPPFQEGSGRVELARAIVDPRNPLTARVMVNRVWMGHFGSGLARTPGDFGHRAEPPTHPELLDWLAARLVASGWSLKDLHRIIVLSSTYRQSSLGPSDPRIAELALARDPDVRFIWRMRAHRLSFEELRDALLAVTGELDDRVGGRPDDLLKSPFPTRRTLYGLVNREDLPSVLRSFDFPNPDLLVPQRNETTVPQQSLFLMNHPFLLERAKSLAESVEPTASESGKERVRRLYDRVFQREPTPRQIEAALAMVSAPESEPAEPVPATSEDWSYGVGKYDESSQRLAGFQPLPHFSGQAWQGGPSWPDGALGWVQLTAEGGHPGNDLDHAAVRRWTAPRDGTLALESHLLHDTSQGDGIRAFLVSDRQGLLASATAHAGDARLNLPSLRVQAGEHIDFVVDIGAGLNNDQYRWLASIRAIGPEPTTWDSRADFIGPRVALGPWAQLAQVLLLSNEFSFFD